MFDAAFFREKLKRILVEVASVHEREVPTLVIFDRWGNFFLPREFTETADRYIRFTAYEGGAPQGEKEVVLPYRSMARLEVLAESADVAWARLSGLRGPRNAGEEETEGDDAGHTHEHEHDHEHPHSHEHPHTHPHPHE